MLKFAKYRQAISLGLIAALVAGCTTVPSREVNLIQGPPIQDVVTPFDEALSCLNGKINNRLTFAVGGIPDQTGTYSNSTEGAGKFVTQGAGDIVQSALFKTGVTLINRRDMGTAALEAQWGLIDLATQQPANFVITGSINSLDFLPGGGAALTVGGVGPSYRQNFILVGLDLAMTNTRTGQILGNISLRKQIFADELGLIIGRFFDDQVVDFEVGGARREAVNYSLRMMLQLATYELLVQMMPANQYAECSEQLDARMGLITGKRTSGEQLDKFRAAAAGNEAAATQKATEQAAPPAPTPSASAAPAQRQATPQQTAASTQAIKDSEVIALVEPEADRELTQAAEKRAKVAAAVAAAEAAAQSAPAAPVAAQAPQPAPAPAQDAAVKKPVIDDLPEGEQEAALKPAPAQENAIEPVKTGYTIELIHTDPRNNVTGRKSNPDLQDEEA